MDLNNIWNSFLSNIKLKINDIAYDTWFSETKLINLNENIATVLVPYHIHKKSLSENYSDIIDEVFTEVTGSNFKFNYVVEEEVENNITESTEIIGVPNNSENFETNLDSRYTFKNFIIGPSNKFAATSALAVAEQPGKMYNPLFIYGSSGLGKTHLMQAIGNYVVKNSNKRVLYIPCDTFINDFIDLYRDPSSNNIEAIKKFKNKYRDVDVLMIDDIHSLVRANSAQQEFFNTFNDLYNNEKQIIISSDRSPDDIKKLEERLKTRFNWGLQVNILPPDFKLRMEILNNKIANSELTEVVPDDVKEYIASNCVGDVRRLEGSITRVFAYATMMNGSEITLDIAKEALKDDYSKAYVSQNKMDQVIQIVCEYYNLKEEVFLSKNRSNEVAIPRMIAMYICRTYLDENLTKIGIKFGGKNHTTVMHAVNKVKKAIIDDDNLNNEIQKMINQIR